LDKLININFTEIKDLRTGKFLAVKQCFVFSVFVYMPVKIACLHHLKQWGRERL